MLKLRQGFGRHTRQRRSHKDRALPRWVGRGTLGKCISTMDAGQYHFRGERSDFVEIISRFDVSHGSGLLNVKTLASVKTANESDAVQEWK